MTKVELIEQITNILDIILSDGIVSQVEIKILQDWIDNNAVEFDGKDYDCFIIPLQKFIEDGELTSLEIESIKAILTEIKGK